MKYGVLCGDCRDLTAVQRLLGGRKVNLVITSPPYADRREYDQSSGFKPIPPEGYVDWYRDVARVIAEVLAPDGSYLLNIKEHAEDGQRVLYVKDLVLAHVRQWGWRFVDEFCWRKTDNGVPGGWGNRFKNAWEPVFHFCRQSEIRFRPKAVGHLSEDCFDYSPNNPKSTSGSGLLGSGRRGLAAENTTMGQAMRKTRASDEQGRFAGIARPSNVIEATTESGQGDHAAPFPMALPEFFIRAFTDVGDLVFDPFGGSGTSAVAALRNGRQGYCAELSPRYCDVIVNRLLAADARLEARLAPPDGDGRTFDQIRGERLAEVA